MVNDEIELRFQFELTKRTVIIGLAIMLGVIVILAGGIWFLTRSPLAGVGSTPEPAPATVYLPVRMAVVLSEQKALLEAQLAGEGPELPRVTDPSFAAAARKHDITMDDVTLLSVMVRRNEADRLVVKTEVTIKGKAPAWGPPVRYFYVVPGGLFQRVMLKPADQAAWGAIGETDG